MAESVSDPISFGELCWCGHREGMHRSHLGALPEGMCAHRSCDCVIFSPLIRAEVFDSVWCD